MRRIMPGSLKTFQIITDVIATLKGGLNCGGLNCGGLNCGGSSCGGLNFGGLNCGGLIVSHFNITRR